MIIADRATAEAYLVRRAHAGQLAGRKDLMRTRRDRKTIAFPGFESADHITGSLEAKLHEVGGGKHR